MKKVLYALPALSLILLPFAASAHEHAAIQVGGSSYQIVIGSLNEPIAVDDKTGLDLTVTKCKTAMCDPTMGEDGDMDGPAGPAVTGLEDTLKVELVAGSQKKTLSITPVWNAEGKYSAAFYPTVATTFAYHLTGKIEDHAVDLTYTCVPQGTTKAEDDMTKKDLGNGVTQIMHGGAFTCPIAKADLGFPEAAVDTNTLADKADSAKTFGMAGVALSAVALAFAAQSLRRKKQ